MFISLPALATAPPGVIVAPITLLLLGDDCIVSLVKDINTRGDSSPSYLTNVNGTLFFGADDGTNGWELWKSDGTTADTVMV
ncbi:MAG: hypothetical protein GY748_26070, partial [Planctomycetaceae bacterium]|nr:hypothetical protein [Planctomycetaceae bacterium]